MKSLISLLILAFGLSAHSEVRIMPLGDSITEGNSQTTPGSYRVILYRQLALVEPGIVFVGSKEQGPPELPQRHHEGHSGWRIDNLITGRTYGSTFEEGLNAWLPVEKPEIILLLIGTNDILQTYDLKNAPLRYQLLLNQIWAIVPHTFILMSSLIPTNNEKFNNLIETFNHSLFQIERNLEKNGYPIGWVDMYKESKINWRLEDLVDGVHPTHQGYNKMANIWSRHTAQVLKNRSTTKK